MRIYDPATGGISDPAAAVRVLKIEISGRAPSATLYYDLAVLSYQAKNKREGNRAAAKAVALAPASEKALLKGYLAKAKEGKSPTEASAGASSGAETVTIPASKLGKGATKAQTVTIPASSLSKTAPGAATVTTGTASAVPTSTAPATTTPKK